MHVLIDVHLATVRMLAQVLGMEVVILILFIVIAGWPGSAGQAVVSDSDQSASHKEGTIKNEQADQP